MKIINHKSVYFYFIALVVVATKTDAASIRNKIVKTINGTAQTLIDGVVDITLPTGSSSSTARRVWISYERGQRVSVLSTMDVSRIISTHMTPIYDFPAMSSVVTMATDEEIAALMANSTIGPINVTDDPIRYPMVHSTKKIRRGQRDLQSNQESPYGIGLTQVDQLWDNTGLTGAGVTVCVIDSGLDVTNPDINAAGYTGTSLVFGSSAWNTDSSGHGTHVTGIVAASNNDIGVVGAAPGANIYTVDVFGEFGFAYASALVDAAYKCRDNGAKIISMSLGGPEYSAQEEKIFSDLFNFNGILSVAAAGNDGNSVYGYPASYDNVLSVGAIDSSKNLATFSTFNDRVDLVAPGVDILSTLPSGPCEICSQTFQSTYGYVSGTSQATPYVSGIAALLWSSNTNLAVNMIYNALINSAADLGSTGRDDFYGNGLVSALAAYNFLTSSSGTAPPAASPSAPPASSPSTPAPLSAPSAPPASSPSTFAPLSAPSAPPASSPITNPPVATLPPDTSCVYASLVFRTDNFPWETYVKLSDVYGGTVLWYGGATEANTDYSLPSTCLNPSGCYLFEFFDSFGDGLCCLNGEGFFELSLDNVPVALGTSFGQYVSYTIGNGCPA